MAPENNAYPIGQEAAIYDTQLEFNVRDAVNFVTGITDYCESSLCDDFDWIGR